MTRHKLLNPYRGKFFSLFAYEDWITHPACVKNKTCQEMQAIRQDAEFKDASWDICDDGCVCGKRVIVLRTWFKAVLITISLLLLWLCM